jgi:hypothetical protein
LIDAYQQDPLPDSLTTIPMDKTNCPLDGAHRLAILAAKGLDVTILTLGKRFPLTYYAFASSFFVKKGMPDLYTDYVALEYARNSCDSYMICLFPSSVTNWENIDNLIRNHVGVFYEKQFYLNSFGKLNFVINLYRNEPWLGDKINDYEGARYKMRECFRVDGNIKVYLVNSENLELVKKIKQDIRDLCSIGNHSVHSTDFRTSSIELAAMSFNNNTVDFLNSVEPTGFGNFRLQFCSYKKYIEDNNLDAANFCIDGSAILAACNLRDCYDLDFLFSGSEETLIGLPDKVDCHNKYMIDCGFDTLLELKINEIISNPRHHFYFEGYKVMNPAYILKIKEFRNEPKDIIDVEYLKSHIDRIGFARDLNSTQKVAPDWYGNFDTLLKDKISNNCVPPVYLNARFYMSERLHNLLAYWRKFVYPKEFRFDPKHYFYMFELFQELDFKSEGSFWLWRETTLGLKNVTQDSDAFLFQRICFTKYLLLNNDNVQKCLLEFDLTFRDFISTIENPELMPFDSTPRVSVKLPDLKQFVASFKFDQ